MHKKHVAPPTGNELEIIPRKMAAIVAVLLSVNLILSDLRLTRASTHWVVTEDGKIQSQMDSVFNMKRPYDLVAFMKQEERATMLDKLKQELLSRKDEIDKTEDRDTGLEEKFYKTDPDCLAAGKHLPDLDLYISTVLPLENKGIRPEDYISGVSPASVLMSPDCTLYTDLPYSPHSFEHLEGLKDRRNLPGTPELGLKNAIIYQDNVDEYGHRIYEAFKHNKTSWVLYNMAAFYWRIKGDTYNVIECVRRALHFSPRLQKDVALISLANVLHRARYSSEAAIVVHAALDLSRELNVNHFTLGNIYAVLGEYNKSVICFENTLKIQPDFEAAAKRKHAVLCHAKLENALEAQHRSLQRTLNELKDYQRKHDYWQQQNDRLLAEQVPVEVKLTQHVAYEELKLKAISNNMKEYCTMGDQDGKQVLMCSWGKPHPGLALKFTAPSEEDLNKKPSLVDEIGADQQGNKRDYNKPVRGPKYTYETVEVPRFQGATEYLDEDWPSKDECDLHVQKVPDPANLSTTYMSPENKGYEVTPLLIEAQGLKDGEEHPLPWYPPVCTTLLAIPEDSDKTHDSLPPISLNGRMKAPLKLYDTAQTQTLLSHVNNGKITIEEIGQRILTALKLSIGPKWILFNLAGLYWRIVGNSYHAIECFRRSMYTCPEEVHDVPETNLANLLYMMGEESASDYLILSAEQNSIYEPATNFLHGNLAWLAKKYSDAERYYKQALKADPYNAEVLNTLRGLKCYLKFHQAAQSAAPPAQYDTQVLNCPPRTPAVAMGTGGDLAQSESRVICKTEGGEEKCVIETRTRSKSGDCEGTCTQTCTVAPVTEVCGGTVEGPEGAASNSCQQPKGPKESSPDEIMFSSEFSSKLEEVSEHLEKHGLCEGDSCDQLKVQPGNQLPHIKLDFVNGVMRQKLILAQSPNEITVEPDECVIFNDGTKSQGCGRPEFKAYQSRYENIQNNPEAITVFINGHKTKVLPVKLRPRPRGHAHNQGQSGDAHPTGHDEQPLGPDKVPPFQAHIVVEQAGDEGGEDEEERQEIQPLAESALPDTTKYMSRHFQMTPPAVSKCREFKKGSVHKFSSTWLSLSAKKINIRDYIDFKTELSQSDHEEPVCDPEYQSDSLTQVDSLPGVQHRTSLEYSSETGLKELLQKLGHRTEQVEEVGARIARALKKNTTSWVLTNMAALYWRVKGDAAKALDCLRVAVDTSPQASKDVALLSIANVLHRSGFLTDAIAATSYTLDVTKNLVIGHFNMANIYASKSDWSSAAKFYESTLSLQSTFEVAKQKLRGVQCIQVLQKQDGIIK